MTPHRLSSRVLIGALVIGVVTPAIAGAAPRLRLRPCPSWTDATGDAKSTYFAGTSNDPNMDITKVRFSSTAKTLDVTISVAKLGAGPVLADGDHFSGHFQVGAKAVFFSYVRYPVDAANTAWDEEIGRGQIYVDMVKVGSEVTAKYDAAKNTVTLSADRAALQKYVGVTAATKLTGLAAKAVGDVAFNADQYDVAPAAKTTTFTLAGCK